jgi:DNA-binding NarL/FixJ family response regulator
MPDMMPTLLIVEDNDVTRERIERAITQEDRFRILASVGSYQHAVEMIQTAPPDILLTDLDLPDGNGIDLIKMLDLPNDQQQLAIVISIFGDGVHVIEALKAGASGYLLKDDNFIEINDAITQMVNGGSPMSPSIARHLLTELNYSSAKLKIDGEVPKASILSKREHEVLILISKGYSTKEIAKMLDLSFHTIKEYVSNIYKKLAVNNRMQAVNEATIQGII